MQTVVHCMLSELVFPAESASCHTAGELTEVNHDRISGSEPVSAYGRTSCRRRVSIDVTLGPGTSGRLCGLS